MVNAGAKTPNKNRKSFANEGDSQTGQTPKAFKPNDSIKTPGKPKFNATPGKGKPKFNATPGKANPKFNATPGKGKPKFNATPGKVNKTPEGNQQSNANTPKGTPFKNQNQGNSGKKNNKRASVSGTESTPPKKLKMFGGTSKLQEAKGEKTAQTDQPKPPKKDKKVKAEEKKIKRKGQFFHLKEKINSGDSVALKELEEKIKAIEGRGELTKTARRKLKLLQRLKGVATGERKVSQPAASQSPSLSQKRRERRKAVKGKLEEKEGQAKTQKPGAKQVEKAIVAEEEGGDDSDSSESDYEVEAEITPDSIIKTTTEGDAEESSDEEDEGEEEESADEEESGDEEGEGESGDEQGEDSDEGESDDEEASSEEAEPEPVVKAQKGRRINVLYTQGGKKKGEEKKNQVKAKNLKLQAMRNQGQLAGSVKQNQKRSFRRGNKKAKVNGSDS